MKKVALAVALAIFVSGGIVVATPVNVAAKPLGASVTNLESFGTSTGTRIRWDVPLGYSTNVKFEVVSCGPYPMFSSLMVHASERRCGAEASRLVTRVTAAPHDATIPCQTNDTYFCVLSVTPISGSVRGTPVMAASGGIAPNAVSDLQVTLGNNGHDRLLSWKPGAVVEQKDDIPEIPQRFEVVRDGVVLSHGVKEAEFRDTTCTEKTLCFYTVTAINTGGRSDAVSVRDIRFLEPSWYEIKPAASQTVVAEPIPAAVPVRAVRKQSEKSRSVVSAMSLISKFVSAAAKDTPTSVTATSGDARITVKWKTPKGAKAGYIKSYKVSTVQKPVKSCTYKVPKTGVSANTCVVTGLKNGTAYTFTVTATSSKGSKGTSKPSAAVKPKVSSNPIVASPITAPPVSSTPVAPTPVDSKAPSVVAADDKTAPGAPTNVTAARGNQRATISWQAPSSAGTSAITSYVASVVGNSAKNCTYVVADANGAGLSCAITGLSNGTLYTFTVVAKSAHGTSLASAESNSIMPATVPAAPTGVTGLLGDQRVTVTWNASEDNGSSVTSYVATAVEDATKTCTNEVPRSGVPTHSCVVDGLTRGLSYTFTVVATNALGSSLSSDASGSFTMLSVPGAPNTVRVASMDQSMLVSWNAPALTGGGPIVAYSVAVNSDASKTCRFVPTPDIPSPFCVVTGLRNGTSYGFSVTASNAVLTSDIASITFGTAGAAAAPLRVTAVPNNGFVDVRWPVSSPATGMRIYQYQVNSIEDWRRNCAVPESSAPVPDLGFRTCRVSGLTNGTSYTFEVEVISVPIGAMGGGWAYSAMSWPTPPVYPATTPDAPSSVITYSFAGGASVAWESAAISGGSPLTGFEVVAVPDTGASGLSARSFSVASASSLTQSVEAESRSTTFYGLVEGVNYSLSVVAKTVMGESTPAVATSPARWSLLPTAPRTVTAQSARAGVLVQWTEPAVIPVAIESYTVAILNVIHPEILVDSITTDGTSLSVSGLAIGDTYRFSVRANNIAGTSPESTTADGVPAGVPSAVIPTWFGANNGGAQVQWTDGADGGAPFVSYTIIATPTGSSSVVRRVVSAVDAPISFGSRTGSVTGLINGVTYSLSVVATTIGGDSDSVVAGTVTPIGPADMPTNVTVVVRNGRAIVSWNPSASDGGSAVLSYQVSALPQTTGHTARSCSVGVIVAPGVQSCTVTGLTNGVSYSFEVNALNGSGLYSGYSAPVLATPLDEAPGAPTNLTATASTSEKLTTLLSWTAPEDDGGQVITAYEVSITGATWQTCYSALRFSTTCKILGLIGGNTYRFKVRAQTSVGDGAYSALTDAFVASGTPSKPVITGVTGTYPNASVSFSTPASNGSDITEYQVKISDTTTGTDQGVVALSSPVAISSLISGHIYTFSVMATNFHGASAYSDDSLPFTSAIVPAAPTFVAATAYDTRVKVAFRSPGNALGQNPLGGIYGSYVSSYRITGKDLTEPRTWTTTITACPPFTPSCLFPGVFQDGYFEVSGLTNDHEYQFSLVATNFAGDSPASTLTSAVTPRDRPSEPQNVVPTRGNGSLSVAFDAPATFATNISSYRVTANVIGGDSWTVKEATGLSSPIVIGGLTNGTRYVVTVTALKGVMEGARATAVGYHTPAAAPSVPSVVSVDAVHEDSQVTLDVFDGATNGSDIVSRTVTVTNITDSSRSKVVVSSTNPIVVTGLTNGHRYDFAVAATNAVGTGPALSFTRGGSHVQPLAPPSAPRAVAVTAGDTTASVSFDAPLNSGGTAIVDYTVTATSSTNSANTRTVTSSASPIALTGLTNGDSYRFTVLASNSGLNGVASVAVSLSPSAPTNVQVTAGDQRAQVSWTPTYIYGEPNDSYVVTASPSGATCTAVAVTNCILTGLSNGTAYTVRVIAVNTAGSSSASSASPSFTPQIQTPATRLTSAPRSVEVNASKGSLVVSWLAPLDSSDGAIIRYTATALPGGATCVSQSMLPCAITGIDPYAIYTVTMTATNSMGTSPTSAISAEASTCGLGVQNIGCASFVNPPKNVIARQVAGGVKVAWFPNSDSDSPSNKVFASPSGASCEVSPVTATLDSSGRLWCVVAGTFATTEVFRVLHRPSDTSTRSFHPSWITISVPVNSNAATPRVTGTLTTESSVRIVAAPISCANPLNCSAAISYNGSVVDGAFDIPLVGTSNIPEGAYNVYAADPTSLGDTSLTEPLLMNIDRTNPTPLTITGSLGVPGQLHIKALSVKGNADCTSSTTLSVEWYTGTTLARGGIVGVSSPTRVAPRMSGAPCTYQTITPAGSLSDGNYVAIATMVDAAGNSSTVTEGFRLDTTSPILAWSTPADSVPEGIVTVAGTQTTASGNSMVVTVKATKGATLVSSEATLSEASSFSSNLNLSPGSWILQSTSADLAGNTTSISRSLTVVPTVGDVSIELPRDGDVVSASTTVSGWAVPGSLVGLSSGNQLLGSTVADSVYGHWFKAVTLPSGATVITATIGATDAAVDITVGTPATAVTIANLGLLGRTNGRPLTGTGPSNSDINVTIDGGASVTVRSGADGYWSVPLTGYDNGLHAVVASRDASTASRSLFIDRVAPSLVVVAPVAGSVVKRIVSFTTPDSNEDEGHVLLRYFSGTNTSVSPFFATSMQSNSGTAQGAMPDELGTGQWTVMASRADAAGNTQLRQVTFLLDRSAPEFSSNVKPLMTAPLVIEGVAGTETGDAALTIKVDDLAVWTAPTSGAYRYQPSPSLASGTHTVTVVQVDAAGNRKTQTEVVVLDSAAPDLTMTLASSSTVMGVKVTGSASGDDGAVTLTMTPDDSALQAITTVTTPIESRYEAHVALTPGWWTIAASRTDAAGNVSTRSIRRLVTTTAPALRIITPNFSRGRTNTIRVSGTTSTEAWRAPTVQVSIHINETSVVVFSRDVNVVAGAFEVVTPALAEGEYVVEVTHDDPSFPVTASTWFSVDTTSPRLTLDAPGATEVGRICGTTVWSFGDRATVSVMAISDAYGSTTQTITPTGAPANMRFCWTPPVGGQWSATATLSDSVGNSTTTEPVVSIVDVTAPSPTVDETSYSCRVTCGVVPPWKDFITGMAGTRANDASTVSVTVVRQFTCSGTNCAVRTPCADSESVSCSTRLSATVLADGTWSAGLSLLASGFWRVQKVSQADTAGNTGEILLVNPDAVDPYRFFVDNTRPVSPTLSVTSNSVRLNACSASAQVRFTSSVKFYKGAAVGDPIASVTAPSSAWCGSFAAITGNKPFGTTTNIPNGVYTVVGETIDGYGNSAVSAASTYRATSDVPIVTIDGIKAVGQQESVTSAPFGSALVISGTASANAVDSSTIRVKLDQTTGDRTFNTCTGWRYVCPGTYARDVVIQANGTWSLTLPSNLPVARYSVRADQGLGSAVLAAGFEVTAEVPTITYASLRNLGTVLNSIVLGGTIPADRPLSSLLVGVESPNVSGVAGGLYPCTNTVITGNEWKCSISPPSIFVNFDTGEYRLAVYTRSAVTFSGCSSWRAVDPNYPDDLLRCVSTTDASGVQSVKGTLTTSLRVSQLSPTIESPSSSTRMTYFGVGPVVVAGSASVGDGVSSEVNIKVYSGTSVSGEAVNTSNATAVNGRYSKALTLADGTWTIQTSQTDGTVRGYSTAVTIKTDTTPPAAAFITPSASESVSSAVIVGTLSGGFGDQKSEVGTLLDSATNWDTSVGTLRYFAGSSTTGSPVRSVRVATQASLGGFFADQPVLANGSYTVVLEAQDLRENKVSRSIAFTVSASGRAPVIPTMAINLRNSAGQSVTFGGNPQITRGGASVEVNVSGIAAGLSPSPTGTVTVYNGSTAIGTGTLQLVPGRVARRAIVSLTGLVEPGEDQQFRVVYNGDASNQSISSAVVPVDVSLPTAHLEIKSLKYDKGAGLPGDVKLLATYIGHENAENYWWYEQYPRWNPQWDLCSTGTGTIKRSDGVTVGSFSLGSQRIRFEYSPLATTTTSPPGFRYRPDANLYYTYGALVDLRPIKLTGSQTLTFAIAGSSECGATSTTVTVDVALSAVRTPTVNLPEAQSYIGGDSAIEVVNGSPGVPAWVEDNAGNIISTTTATTDGNGDATLHVVPTTAGLRSIKIFTGGSGSGYATTEIEKTLPVEPSMVSPVLTTAADPRKAGSATVATLTLGGPNLRGAVRVQSGAGAAVNISSLTCSVTTCSAVTELPTDLLDVGTDGRVTAVFTSSITNKVYSVTESLQRTVWEPTLSLEVGAGPPSNLAARASGSAAVTVSWAEPPALTSTTLRYIVTASPGNQSCWAGVGNTSCTVTGLTNDVDYTFAVVTESLAGTSGAMRISATPNADYVAGAATAVGVPLSAGQSVRDRLVPVKAVLTFPQFMPTRLQKGIFAIESTPNCHIPGSDYVDQYTNGWDQFCNGQLHRVEFDLTNNTQNESLRINGVDRSNFSARTWENIGLSSSDLTAVTTRNNCSICSSYAITVNTQMYISGSDSRLSSHFTADRSTVLGSADVSTSVRGVGAPVTWIEVASATITGGPVFSPLLMFASGWDFRGPSQRVSGWSTWGVRNPKFGETAFVRSLFDPVFHVPDEGKNNALVLAQPGVSPAFVGRDRLHENRPSPVPGSVGYVEMSIPDVNVPATTSCRSCEIQGTWAVRNLETFERVETGGGLDIGSHTLAVVTYKESVGAGFSGPDAEVQSRAGLRAFAFDVDQLDTTTRSQVALALGPELTPGTPHRLINVLTEARWIGVAAEMQMPLSDILLQVTYASSVDGQRKTLAMCFFSGVCMESDGNGQNFMHTHEKNDDGEIIIEPQVAGVINGRMSMSIDLTELPAAEKAAIFANNSSAYMDIQLSLTSRWGVPFESPIYKIIEGGVSVADASAYSVGAASFSSDAKRLGDFPEKIDYGDYCDTWDFCQLTSAAAWLNKAWASVFTFVFGEEAGKWVQLAVELLITAACAICGIALSLVKTLSAQTPQEALFSSLGVIGGPMTKGLGLIFKSYKAAKTLAAANAPVTTTVWTAKAVPQAMSKSISRFGTARANLLTSFKQNLPTIVAPSSSSIIASTGGFVLKVGKGWGIWGASRVVKQVSMSTSNNVSESKLEVIPASTQSTQVSPFDPQFVLTPKITEDFGERVLANENDPDLAAAQTAVSNWENAIADAYRKASTPKANAAPLVPVTSIYDTRWNGHPGFASKYIHVFAMQANISVPIAISGAANGISIDLLNGPGDDARAEVVGTLGTCIAGRACENVPKGIDVKLYRGALSISGIYPQDVAWVPTGAWVRIQVIRTNPNEVRRVCEFSYSRLANECENRPFAVAPTVVGTAGNISLVFPGKRYSCVRTPLDDGGPCAKLEHFERDRGTGSTPWWSAGLQPEWPYPIPEWEYQNLANGDYLSADTAAFRSAL